MKRLFLIAMLCGCWLLNNTYGQNNYQNIENFKPGTTLVFQSCKTDTFETGQPGENAIWDFSYLKPEKDTITERIMVPDALKSANDYPQSTLVEQYSDGSAVYLKTGAHKRYLLGYVSGDSKIKIRYPKPVLLALRPFSYGDSLSEPYTTAYSVNGMDFTGTGMATVEADGFGTLILPNKTYPNTLRIKIIQKQSDMMTQYHSGSETTVITYVWFDKNHSSALLKMTETKSQYHSDKSIEYLLSEMIQ